MSVRLGLGPVRRRTRHPSSPWRLPSLRATLSAAYGLRPPFLLEHASSVMSQTPCLDENSALELIEARLSSAERTAVERHLEGCDACRELVAELAKDAFVDEADSDAEAPAPSRGADTERNPLSDGATSTLPQGFHAGPYRIDRPIGSGSAGVVYRAIDERTNQIVALKYVTDIGLRARFAREAETLARLDHDAIVRYIGHGETPGGMYLAMEWLEGEDLEERFRKSGALGWEGARTIGLRLSAALAHAHGLGCVHRDLSPRNVYLPEGRLERAKLLDFGLVRLNLSGELARTATHAVLGTPFYMSPEQVRDPKSVTARSDLFGIGVLMYEAIAGIRPFHGDDLFAVWVKIVDLPAPDLRGLVRAFVPEPLIVLVESLLAKDPAARPASAEEVNQRLLALSTGGPVTTAVLRPMAPPVRVPAPVAATAAMPGMPAPAPLPVHRTSGPPAPHASTTPPIAPIAPLPPPMVPVVLPPAPLPSPAPAPAPVPASSASTHKTAVIVAAGVFGVSAAVVAGGLVYTYLRRPTTITIVPSKESKESKDEEEPASTKVSPPRGFPLKCADNETIELTGPTYSGSGPLVTRVGSNCTIKIKNAQLKGNSLLETSETNLELTLENVTLEAADVGVRAGGNFKLRVRGSTITANGNAFEGGANFDVLELVDSTVVSRTRTAFRSDHSMTIQATNAKIRGKEAAVFSSADATLTMKSGSEISSEGGPAFEGGANSKIVAEGGKIEGLAGVRGPMNLTIDAHDLVIASTKEPAIRAGNGGHLVFVGGSVQSKSGPALSFDAPVEVVLGGTQVSGAEGAVVAASNLNLTASKKARLVATSGHGINAGINLEVKLEDATIEAPGVAIKATSNTKVRLERGGRLSGKGGGLVAETNLEVTATEATIEGGGGAGISGFIGARIVHRSGVLRGVPALVFDRPPLVLDLVGTRIEGEQKTRGR